MHQVLPPISPADPADPTATVHSLIVSIDFDGSGKTDFARIEFHLLDPKSSPLAKGLQMGKCVVVIYRRFSTLYPMTFTVDTPNSRVYLEQGISHWFGYTKAREIWNTLVNERKIGRAHV